jgi:hypothetical protein
MVDENQAPYVPPDMAPVSYHCPNTGCTGHFYLKTHELGQPQTCQKCGLAVTIGWREPLRASGSEETSGASFRLRTWFVRAGQRPEFRIAILASAIWLLLIQAYQPWRYYRGYKSSHLLEEVALFFWRIGSNGLPNGPVAVLVGLTVITVLTYIVGWVVRSFGRINGLPRSPAAIGGARYPRKPRDGGLATSEDAGTGVRQPGAATGFDRFLQLCHAIRLNCWQQVRGDDASREANNEALKRAYTEYRQQVRPWLSAMIDAYGIDAEVMVPARNAAARCLVSFSGGFLRVNNLADAENLASEALLLAIDDDALEAEIRGQLDEVRSEQERSRPKPRRVRLAGRFWRTVARTVAAACAVVVVLAGLVYFDGKRADRVEPASVSGTPPRPKALPSIAPYAESAPVQSKVEPKILNAVPEEQVLNARETAAPSQLARGVGEFMACRDDPNMERTRPRNGAEPGYEPGGESHGRLVVTNGNSQDAAVILADLAAQEDGRLMYIRSGMQATMTGILPGQYQIMFQTGKNWDERAENFRCVADTALFDKTESFTEDERPDGIEYSRLSITLHKVAGGNARTRSIAQQSFVRKRLYRLSPSK